MNRGIVMKVERKHVVLMTPDGQFVKVTSKQKAAIGDEIMFSDSEQPRSRRSFRPRYLASTAAVITLLVIPAAFWVQSASHSVVAYVSMDINPSIELGVDKEEDVWKLRALNDDGAKMIQGLDFKGKPVDEVAAEIMENVGQSHYLDTEERDIVITSILVDNPKKKTDYETELVGKVDKAVRTKLVQFHAEQKAVVTTFSAPKEVRKEAASNGISSGKMVVYLMAKQKGHDIKLDQLKTQSIQTVTKPIGGVQTMVQRGKGTDQQSLKEQLKKQLDEEHKRKKQQEKLNNDAKSNGQIKTNDEFVFGYASKYL